MYIFFILFYFALFCDAAGARYPDGAGYFGTDHQVCAGREQRLMEGTLFQSTINGGNTIYTSDVVLVQGVGTCLEPAAVCPPRRATWPNGEWG